MYFLNLNHNFFFFQDLIKYHRIDSNVETDALTKSEASRLIDKILSSYGRIME